MIDIPKDKIDEIAKAFYWIIYGKGSVIPRISIKIRLGLLFGDEYFEKEYIEKLKEADFEKMTEGGKP